MASRILILPLATIDLDIGRGVPVSTQAPKYAQQILDAGGTWGMMDLETLCVARVSGITQAQMSTLIAQPDVRAIPEDLDAPLGAGAITAAQAVADFLNLPSGWIQAGQTSRQIVRGLLSMVVIRQRARRANLLGDGRTLSTRVADVPVPVRQAMLDAIDSLGINRGDVDGTWTLGRVLRDLATRYAKTIYIGGEAF